VLRLINTVDAVPELNERSIWLGILPFSFSAGLFRLTTTLFVGGTATLLERFDPVRALETIERDRVTCINAVPPMFLRMMEQMERQHYDLSSLTSVMFGGAVPAPELVEKMAAAFGVMPRVVYGSAESGGLAATPSGELPRPGSVGRIWWGVEVRIADDEDNPLPTGTSGEVLVRSPMNMKGYYKQPAQTAETMRNGWVHTGDIGYLDEADNLYIVDRKKNVINRGGAKVFPAEVEQELLSHPAVLDAAVVGVPDAVQGEEVKAFVVLRPGMALTADEIIAYCRQRMAKYKAPRLVEFCPELPRSPHGKLVKIGLR